jgi:hypothetical protein
LPFECTFSEYQDKQLWGNSETSNNLLKYAQL